MLEGVGEQVDLDLYMHAQDDETFTVSRDGARKETVSKMTAFLVDAPEDRRTALFRVRLGIAIVKGLLPSTF